MPDLGKEDAETGEQRNPAPEFGSWQLLKSIAHGLTAMFFYVKKIVFITSVI